MEWRLRKGGLRGFTVQETVRQLIGDHSILNPGVENINAIL